MTQQENYGGNFLAPSVKQVSKRVVNTISDFFSLRERKRISSSRSKKIQNNEKKDDVR